MEERQEELEELRARVKALEKRRTEMAEELDKADERRREAEEWWRSKMKEVEQEKGTMQSTLDAEIQTLTQNHEELLKESRSKLQDSLRELEEARVELSRNRAVMEEQKTRITLLIADREESGEQRRRRDSQEERGEVHVNTEELFALIEEVLMSVCFVSGEAGGDQEAAQAEGGSGEASGLSLNSRTVFKMTSVLWAGGQFDSEGPGAAGGQKSTPIGSGTNRGGADKTPLPAGTESGGGA